MSSGLRVPSPYAARGRRRALPLAPRTRVKLSGVNLFDRRHAELPGSPEIGRLLTLMLRTEL